MGTPGNGAGEPGAISITRRDQDKSWEVATGSRHEFVLRPLQVYWLEVEDVLFHHDSAVLMPETEPAGDDEGSAAQRQINGLGVLRAAYLHAQDNPQQKLLVAGHTDTSGGDALNEELARLRAESVLHALLGNKDDWVAIADGRHKTSDIKQILRWVARWRGWPCDPGVVDERDDPATREAVEAFQTEFSKPGNGYPIGVDGIVGPQTWGAFFHLYMDRLGALCGTDAAGLAAFRSALNWLYDDLQRVSCGEYHPVDMPGKDGFKSQQNRRVEMLFYDPGEEPLHKPPGDVCHSDGKGGAADCHVYSRTRYAYTRVVPKRLDIVSVDDHFAPKHEKLAIRLAIEGLAGDLVKLEVTSPHYSDNPIYVRELEAAERADGTHRIEWDGKATCAAGDLKERYLHPLYGVYQVRIYGTGKYADTATFKVLYHSVALRRGPWAPDEEEPPQTDEKAWVQYRLNELGYYGGPVGKDTESYLSRAIVRYKANHRAMHELDYSDYDDAITEALKAALAAGDNPRPFLDGAALTDPAKESRIFVEALTYESKGEFTQNKASKENGRLNRPLIPVEAQIFLKSKTGEKVWVPEAVGPVRVNWRFRDPDEDLSVQYASTAANPSKTRAYVEKCLKLRSGRTGSNGDNCHKDFGGIRDVADRNGFQPALLGDFYKPYDVQKDGGQKVVYSVAWDDAAKFPKRVGFAGFYFRPSHIAGDDYRVCAELDFSTRANKDELEGLHGIVDEASRIAVESGTFRVWRFGKVAVRVTWPPRANSNEWVQIATEFEKAYLDIDVGSIITKKVSDVITESQYKEIVADHTDHKKKDVKLLNDSLVGVELPAQGSRTAPQYRTALKTFTSDNYWNKIVYKLREKLSENIRKEHPTGFVIVEFLTHRPVTVRKAPPGDMTVSNANYVTWSFSIGLPDSMIFADQKDPDKVYYVVAHEMGHNYWLKHWEHAGGSRSQDHDQADHNCTMSYSNGTCAHAHHRPGVYTPRFCGQCNLKLRGWDIDHAAIPADST